VSRDPGAGDGGPQSRRWPAGTLIPAGHRPTTTAAGSPAPHPPGTVPAC
jgi:hypothetical protein